MEALSLEMRRAIILRHAEKGKKWETMKRT